MSPRAPDRERNDEDFSEENVSDESSKGSCCKDGKSCSRESEEDTPHLLPSTEDFQLSPVIIEEIPCDSPLPLITSQGSSDARSRRYSFHTSRDLSLSYDDMTPGSARTVRAPSPNSLNDYFEVIEQKEKMVHTGDEPKMERERAQGSSHRLRELKCAKVLLGDDDHLVCCDVSPVSVPGHDLHHLKTRVSQSNIAPSKVRQLHFTETRPLTHQTGLEDDLPSVSHDFVTSRTKALTYLYGHVSRKFTQSSCKLSFLSFCCDDHWPGLNLERRSPINVACPRDVVKRVTV
jgi:hypothetical protein